MISFRPPWCLAALDHPTSAPLAYNCFWSRSRLVAGQSWGVGCCHSDLFSSVVTSWPLCLAVACCGYHHHHLPPTQPWIVLSSSSNRSSGSRAAEDLNRSGMTAPPFRCVTWGGGGGLYWSAVTKYSVQGAETMSFICWFNNLLDSSIQAGLLGHGS